LILRIVLNAVTSSAMVGEQIMLSCQTGSDMMSS
jgi:hypothetical protein